MAEEQISKAMAFCEEYDVPTDDKTGSRGTQESHEGCTTSLVIWDVGHVSIPVALRSIAQSSFCLA